MTFILPKWGGAMVHSDPQLTDNIDLPVPRGNVEILWYRNELTGEKAGAKGNGIAGNGEIAACTFHGLGDNLVIYDYEGKRLWSSGDMLNAVAVSSTPLVSIHNEIIACDNRRILMVTSRKDDFWVKWVTDIPREGGNQLIPFSPTIVEGKIIILPTKNGPVYAFDAQTGEFLTKKKLGSSGVTGDEYFSTINSACVHEKRVYIIAESFKPGNKFNGRFYALDVDTKVENDSEVLAEAWYYPFNGRSQASPLFIEDTIYFDCYLPGPRWFKKPCVYAVTDEGEGYTVCEKFYPNRTWFSFSRDPRGGFWYEDTRGKKLIRFKKENGGLHIDDIIFMEKLGIPRSFNMYKPLSCMTICEMRKPVMLISAVSFWPRQYLLAIDLNDDSVLWRVTIDKAGWNYAGGQFTILKNKFDPCRNRIVFGTYWGGVMAIGVKE